MTGVGGDVGPNIPYQHHSAMNCFLIVKLAAPILELADCRHAYSSIPAIRKIEAPLARPGIVEAQVQSFHVTCGTIDLEFHEIGFPVPNLPNNRSAHIFAPGASPTKRMNDR